MLFFGHIGIVAGVAKAGSILMSMTRLDGSLQSDSSLKFDAAINGERWHSHHLLSGIKDRAGLIDYRMVLLGSLLPDIIDKPVWFLINSITGDAALSGRGYAHTLLFNLALFIGGLVLMRYRKSWLLLVSLSSFMHLILDQIWNKPAVLLWPLLGPLPRGQTAGWLSDITHGLFSRPDVYIPEIMGLVIILLFTYRVVMRKSILSFLKGGAIG